MTEYEDTVMPETGACRDCGETVDEGDNYGEDGVWLCRDCADAAALAGVDV